MAKVERRAKLIKPDQRKNISMVADAVGRWGERLRALEEDGPEQRLPSAYKVIALKAILPDAL